MTVWTCGQLSLATPGSSHYPHSCVRYHCYPYSHANMLPGMSWRAITSMTIHPASSAHNKPINMLVVTPRQSIGNCLHSPTWGNSPTWGKRCTISGRPHQHPPSALTSWSCVRQGCQLTGQNTIWNDKTFITKYHSHQWSFLIEIYSLLTSLSLMQINRKCVGWVVH